jgi:hypothetical protein
MQKKDLLRVPNFQKLSFYVFLKLKKNKSYKIICAQNLQ